MNNDNNFFKKNGFSIAICSLIAIVIVSSLYLSYNNFTNDKNKIIKSEESEIIVNKSDVKSYKETTTTENYIEQTTNFLKESLKENTTSIETTTEVTTQTIQNNEKEKPKEESKVFSLFDETQEMSWPVFGNIVSKFDMTTGVYDKTLEQYKVSDSICISAPVGTDVKAAAEGIVENIFIDDELGQTIAINHGNGWLSTYSQLQDKVSVNVGDVVSEGKVIGKIGNPSKYGVALGSHLNFKVLKDDKPTDPTEILSQQEE